MTEKSVHPHVVSRRAELLAELFLQELKPGFLSRPTQDVGYDFLVGFDNARDGINTFAVQVKATERPIAGRISIARKIFNRLTHSNIPALLLAIDVKDNRLYYAWLNPGLGVRASTPTIAVPVVELDDEARRRLKQELRAPQSPLPVATAT